MSSIRIVTDSAALFSEALFEGRELVSTLNMHIQVGDELIADTVDAGVCQRLAAMPPTRPVHLMPPTVSEVAHIFSELSAHTHAIICILSSDNLCGGLANALQAAEIAKGPASIQVIDSLTIGPGLGFLVQEAARAARSERNDAQLGRHIRGLLPHIYSAFLFPSLRPLAEHGQVDIAQSFAAEMFGLLPYYVLEGGRLIPQRKARTMRQAQDALHEFAEEFDNLRHLAVFQGIHTNEHDLHNLNNRLSQLFPRLPLKEFTFNASLIALFGGACFGVTAMEKEDIG